MKVELVRDKEYKPIVITLETEDEYKAIHSSLVMVVKGRINPGETTIDRIIDILESLDEVRQCRE